MTPLPSSAACRLPNTPVQRHRFFCRGKPAPIGLLPCAMRSPTRCCPKSQRTLAAIYVNDMGRAKNWDRPEVGTWVEARKAVFVIESRRRGGMNENEAVPFSDQAAAATFISQYGGRLVSFAEMPKSYILSDGQGAYPKQDAGSDRVAHQRESRP